MSKPTDTVDPFSTFTEKQSVDAKIAALQKQSKALKAVIEEQFRANQKRINHPSQPLVLMREEKTVQPFHNPGYSYWIYKLQAKDI